jgi:hypothetical protein
MPTPLSIEADTPTFLRIALLLTVDSKIENEKDMHLRWVRGMFN